MPSGKPHFGRRANTAAARAALIAQSNETRAEEATFIFHKYDSANKGGLVEDDLLRCFTDLGFSNGRQNKTGDELRDWVRRELKRGNKKGTGSLSHDEFVDYYNKFVVGHRRRFEETYELGQQIGKGAFGFVFRAKRIGGVEHSIPIGAQVCRTAALVAHH